MIRNHGNIHPDPLKWKQESAQRLADWGKATHAPGMDDYFTLKEHC